MRARFVSKADGTGRRACGAEDWTRDEAHRTQIVGWSRTGKTAIARPRCESEENGIGRRSQDPNRTDASYDSLPGRAGRRQGDNVTAGEGVRTTTVATWVSCPATDQRSSLLQAAWSIGRESPLRMDLAAKNKARHHQ